MDHRSRAKERDSAGRRWLPVMRPIPLLFSCCVAASSKTQPLTIDCAMAPLTPVPSSSVREARKMACGLRNRSSSRLEVRVPSPETSFRASQ